MEEKIYRSSIIAVIWNSISILLGVAIVSFMIGYFFGLQYAAIVAVILGVPVMVNLVHHSLMKVTITDTDLHIVIGKKQYHYRLDEIVIHATRTNNDTFTLDIQDSTGKTEYFDFSMIGLINYYNLLDDLKVTGENSKVVKLDAVQKNSKGE